MVYLKEIDETNLGQCEELKLRKRKYVGEPLWILAEAYIHRDITTAYAIYNDEKIVGMVLLLDLPDRYRFTDLFIGTKYQRKGYAKEAVKCAVEMFKREGKHTNIDIFVHKSNIAAKKVYENSGFVAAGHMDGDESFSKMCLAI